MQNAVSIPVTVKHRIGIDHQDDYQDMAKFVSTVAATGCKTFIVHARKAWLKGLSPKENREVPPLDYDKVIQLKNEFPQLEIIINGGITNLDQSEHLLKNLDGVMIGREAYSNPYMLAEVDQQLFSIDKPTVSRETIFEQFIEYCEENIARGIKLSHMTRHILGLFQGQPGARSFRRILSEKGPRPDAGIEVLKEAFDSITNSQSTASD
jgi:tRNA-dihydrouridine synthase A